MVNASLYQPGRQSSAKGGRGVPPFSTVKIGQKNSAFWAKNAVFSEILASRRPLREGAQWANLGLQAVELNQYGYLQYFHLWDDIFQCQ